MLHVNTVLEEAPRRRAIAWFIEGYVSLLNQYGMAAILDLHWTAPGSAQATAQEPMPDQDHAPAFWTSAANAFKGNSSVLFDLFNEPYPDSNRDTTAAWSCLKNGGTCSGVSYQAAGMQELVNTVRATGARNIIMVGGIGYAGILDQWLTYRPSDPDNNLAASWHNYNFGWCNSLTCWNSQGAPVAVQVPLITGEIGENDCTDTCINPLMSWLDAHGASYLGWAWDTANCSSFPALISNYNGTPTAFGTGFQSHLTALAGAAPPPATAAPTASASPTVTLNQASASPTTAAPGTSVTLSATVTATAAISNAIIDFEIYTSANARVYQTYQSVNLAANTAQTFTASWPVPSSQASGSYTLRIGVFGPTWAPTYVWDAPAAGIMVSTPVPPTATPTAGSSPTVTVTSASSSPATVAPGSSTTLSATVRSSAAVSGAIVDFEVYNSANARVYQGFQAVSLAANASQTFVSSWAVPGSQAAGGYVLKIGVFGPNWAPTFAWDNSAAGITVS